jgi:hypothetical protein
MEAMRHDHGSVLPDEIRKKLHATELDYFKQYDGLLTEYMAAIDVDLTSVRILSQRRRPHSPSRASCLFACAPRFTLQVVV